MITCNLQEAKAKLNNLVDQAIKGEQIVLLRGSKVIASIVPLSAQDIEISPMLTDRQAQRFWDEAENEKCIDFPSAEAAVKYLKKRRSASPKRK